MARKRELRSPSASLSETEKMWARMIEILQTSRIRQGFTPEEVVAKIKLENGSLRAGKASVARAERWESEPKLDFVFTWAKVLGLEMGDLFEQCTRAGRRKRKPVKSQPDERSDG